MNAFSFYEFLQESMQNKIPSEECTVRLTFVAKSKLCFQSHLKSEVAIRKMRSTSTSSLSHAVPHRVRWYELWRHPLQRSRRNVSFHVLALSSKVLGQCFACLAITLLKIHTPWALFFLIFQGGERIIFFLIYHKQIKWNEQFNPKQRNNHTC